MCCYVYQFNALSDMVNATNTGMALLRKSQADLQARLGTVVSAQGNYI